MFSRFKKLNENTVHIQNSFLNLLEVLGALKKMHITPPAPFSQNSQYKKNLQEDGPSDGYDADGDPPAEPVANLKAAKTKGGKAPVAAPSSHVLEKSDDSMVYKANDYSSIRKAFIQNLKSQGVASSEANDGWNKSDQKRRLLATLPLNELKRRRFVPKGTTVHPWAMESEKI